MVRTRKEFVAYVVGDMTLKAARGFIAKEYFRELPLKSTIVRVVEDFDAVVGTIAEGATTTFEVVHVFIAESQIDKMTDTYPYEDLGERRHIVIHDQNVLINPM